MNMIILYPRSTAYQVQVSYQSNTDMLGLYKYPDIIDPRLSKSMIGMAPGGSKANDMVMCVDGSHQK